MKATLEFNLPEEQSSFKIASDACALYSCLHECHERLRTYIKHGNPDDEPPMDVLIEVRGMLSIVWDYE